jgi:hypothetical protein
LRALHGNAAAACQFAHAKGPNQREEAFHIAGRAGDLDDHALLTHGEHTRRGGHAQTDECGPSIGVRIDSHQRSLPLERISRCRDDLDHRYEPLQLLHDLFGRGRIDDQRHAHHPHRFGRAEGDAIDREPAPAQQADDAIQHHRLVLHVGDKSLLHVATSPFGLE